MLSFLSQNCLNNFNFLKIISIYCNEKMLMPCLIWCSESLFPIQIVNTNWGMTINKSIQHIPGFQIDTIQLIEIHSEINSPHFVTWNIVGRSFIHFPCFHRLILFFYCVKFNLRNNGLGAYQYEKKYTDILLIIQWWYHKCKKKL